MNLTEKELFKLMMDTWFKSKDLINPIAATDYINKKIELIKKLNTHTVNGFYYLQDGDEVKNGDEYYDYDDGCEWKLIDHITEPQEFDQEEEYQVRRKVMLTN